MTDRPPDLAELFRELRRSESAPPFSRVWRRALDRRRGHRRRRWLLRTAAALPAAALLVVLLVPALERREPAPQLAGDFPRETYELARSLSEWQAPLDFLLEPPGGHLLGLEARAPVPELPTEIPTRLTEEIYR